MGLRGDAQSAPHPHFGRGVPFNFVASGLRRVAAACLAHRAPATAAGLQRAAAGRGPGADGAAVAASPIVLVARPPRVAPSSFGAPPQARVAAALAYQWTPAPLHAAAVLPAP